MTLPFVEDLYFYSRENSTLIAIKTNGEKIPLVKFKQKFIDISIVGGSIYDYMISYMETFPELCEIIYPPKNNKQLELF
jgi:hypothetical protein